jgi:hypothetical protein
MSVLNPRGERRSPLPQFVVALAAAILMAASPEAGRAQSIDQTAPSHLAIVDGEVTLDRNAESAPGDVGMPVVPGDRVRTSRGRAEIVTGDGSRVDLDEYSTLEIKDADQFRLDAGRVRVEIVPDAAVRYQVDTEAATARLNGAGIYRVGVLGTSYAQAELVVVRGDGELASDRGSVRLRPGERSVAWSNDVPARPEPINTARADAFEQWATGLPQPDATGRSAQYLPPDLRAYGGTLDQYGDWQYEPSYGYVWYPTVAAGWRPYYDGYWASVPRYGWTWIGVNVWAWPTHHYGRWGYLRSRWFWIPERHWAPAWVSWGAAPGYVSWCPLGIDNRPVFALSASTGGRFGGWVAVPGDRFGVGRARVARYALPPRSFATHGFVVQSAPPAIPPRTARQWSVGERPNVAVPRASNPGRVPDTIRTDRSARSAAPRDRTGGSRIETGSPNGRAVPPAAVRSRSPRANGSDDGRSAERTSGDRRGEPYRQPGTAQAVPRTASPQRDPGAAPQYPFGDFRRSGGSVSSPGQSPAPANNPRDTATVPPPAEPRIVAPPPASSGVARPRYERSRDDARPSPPSRGGSVSTTPRSASPGAERSSGNEGRAHAPASRNPSRR